LVFSKAYDKPDSLKNFFDSLVDSNIISSWSLSSNPSDILNIWNTSDFGILFYEPSPDNPLTTSELDSIKKFLDQGGKLIYIDNVLNYTNSDLRSLFSFDFNVFNITNLYCNPYSVNYSSCAEATSSTPVDLFGSNDIGMIFFNNTQVLNFSGGYGEVWVSYGNNNLMIAEGFSVLTVAPGIDSSSGFSRHVSYINIDVASKNKYVPTKTLYGFIPNTDKEVYLNLLSLYSDTNISIRLNDGTLVKNLYLNKFNYYSLNLNSIRILLSVLKVAMLSLLH